MKYVVKRTEDGAYMARGDRAWVYDIRKATTFASRETAEEWGVCENECVVSVESERA